MNINTIKRYSNIMRFMHHLVGIIIISLLAVGIYMADLPKEDPNRMLIYTMHKTFGWLVLWLVIIRLSIKLKQRPYFVQLPLIWQRLANFGHFILYILMFTMPLSGWLMSSAAGYNVVLFGINQLTIPNLIDKNKELASLFKQVHEIAAWILIAVIIGHVIAALKHKYCHKNDVLSRMLP